MLIIELNEFNPSYLKKVSKKLKLKNIEKIFKLNHSFTTTDEEIEYQGLDPWVQWVGIHTGKSFKEHSICRLSETRSQKFSQIWNEVSEKKKLNCGIWGVMNAPCGNKKGIKFFVPDPWSFDEVASPNNLNDFLSLPRYMAKNYLSRNFLKLLIPSFKMIKFIFFNRGNGKTRKFLKKLVHISFTTGINVHSLSTLLDYLSTLYFLELKTKFKTDFNIIFLNHIAHLQHQFWGPPEEISNEMKLGLITCDEIIGMLFDNLKKDEKLMIINGLTQKLVKDDNIFVYRQKDPASFFESFEINAIKIEQNMTNDGVLIFDENKKMKKALNVLKNLHLKSNKKQIFYIEELSPFKLFYQINIKEKIKSDELIISKEKSYFFYDLIKFLCKRTGAHIPEGEIFYKGLNVPHKIYNHEIYNYLLNSI